MKQSNYLNTASLVVIILLLLAFVTQSANAQQINKVFDEIGGGGSTPTSTEDSGSSTTLYIVGGAVIAGIIIYALLRDKKEPETKDTAAVITDTDLLSQSLIDEQKLSAEQTQVPFNIFIGSQSDKVFRDDKRYFVGVSLSF